MRSRSKPHSSTPYGDSRRTFRERRSYDDSDINVLRLLVTESALDAHLQHQRERQTLLAGSAGAAYRQDVGSRRQVCFVSCSQRTLLRRCRPSALFRPSNYESRALLASRPSAVAPLQRHPFYKYNRADFDRAQTSGFLWRRALHHRTGFALNTMDEVDLAHAVEARGLLRCPTCLHVATVPLFAQCGHCFCSEQCLAHAKPCRACKEWGNGVASQVPWRQPSTVPLVASVLFPGWSFDTNHVSVGVSSSSQPRPNDNSNRGVQPAQCFAAPVSIERSLTLAHPLSGDRA